MQTMIETFEARKEFTGRSLLDQQDQPAEGELLPVIVRLQSPVPDVPQLLSLFGQKEQSGSDTGTEDPREDAVQGEASREHVRVLAQLQLLIGELTPESLKTLLDSGMVQHFSWDNEELVYFRTKEQS